MSWGTGSAVIAGAIFGVGALGVAAPALDGPSEQDTAWLSAAHQTHLTGIAAGTAAQDRATTEDVRALGARSAEIHRSLDADLTDVAAQLDVPLPARPSPKQQAELAAVMAREGADFDTAWVAHQLGLHYTARAAGQQEIAKGERRRSADTGGGIHAGDGPASGQARRER